MNKKFSLLFCILVCEFLIIGISFAFESISFLIFATVLLFVGNTITIIFIKPENKLFCSLLFSCSFAIYLCSMMLISWGYYTETDNISGYPDEKGYLYVSNIMANDISNNTINIRKQEYRDWIGYALLVGSITMYSEYFNEKPMINHKIISIFFGSLLSVIFFLFSNNFFNRNISRGAACIFSIFPFVIMYSSVAIRDIHVVFSTLFLFYCLSNILMKKRIFVSIIGVFLIALILLGLRIENFLFGIGVIGVIGLVAFSSKIFKLGKTVSFLYVVIVMLSAGFVMQKSINQYTTEYQRILFNMLINSQDQAKSNSLGLLMQKLPFGMNYIGKVMMSQIQPFPYLARIENSISRLPEVMGGFFWFFIWPFILLGLLNKKLRKSFDSKFYPFLILSIVYIVLGAIIQPVERRLLAVYPVLFIFGYNCYHQLSINQRTNTMMFGLSSLFVLFIVYFKLKGGII